MSFVFSNIPICGKDTIEQYIMTLIAGGDLGYREKLSSLADPSQPFSPPSDDSILLWRHLAISHLLLASRAAADGGLPARTAADLISCYRQEISDAAHIDQLNRIYDRMIDDFVYRVHSHRQASALSAPIRQCMSYIDSRYDQKLTADLIASRVGYSSSHLSRRFREELGLSLTEYILKVRMEHAIRLLRLSQLSIADICKAVGFHSQSHFSRQFRKYTGTAPGLFRTTGYLPPRSSFERSR